MADTPHDLYVDEVSIGYNAYSILKTGKDEHGQSFPIFLKAFEEYKLPVYIYLTTVSEAIFGKTPFAVRFPSALFGTLSVAIFILLIPSLAFSSLIRNPYEGVRPTGMGNAYIAISDDFNALWYNPAGLTKIKGFHFNLFIFYLYK